ncbi:MAG: DpnI domain-containing protein [Nanoarchaeota archaeon]|nr:DpnI domain-containing protein [Nanoarchaeota archaeon]
MNLSLANPIVLVKYKSNSQRIRVLTEQWMASQMFCPHCLHSQLTPFANNNPVADFSCSQCKEQFQLKSQLPNFGRKINDGAYGVMIKSIHQNMRPNFFFLQYTVDYYVKNLFLVPSFFFTPEVIEKRKPLAESAKRAGWIGCNVLLEKIPPEGRIPIIQDGNILQRKIVEEKWHKIEFIKKSPLIERSWTIDILNVIHQLKKKDFTLQDIYQYEKALAMLHPNNFHVKDKIRQQLQILRDKNLLQFKGKGKYVLK